MRRLLVGALVLTVWATGAWADRYSDCDQNADLYRRIRGCTQIIERGEQETRKSRAHAYGNRGIAYHYKGEVDRAIADYTQAIKINPNNANLYYLRGRAYVDKSQYDKAIPDLTQAIALKPSFAWAYNNRGIAYERKGEYDRAIADYTQAVKINPNDADLYFNRAGAYEKKGDREQAIADYREALKITPSDQDAKRALERLGVTAIGSSQNAAQTSADLYTLGAKVRELYEQRKYTEAIAYAERQCRHIAHQPGRPVPTPRPLCRGRAALQAGACNLGKGSWPRAPRCRLNALHGSSAIMP